MNSFEYKQTFFELGIAFARFSAKPDEDEHKIICNVASRLELEIPDFGELLIESLSSGGVVTPPSKWFEGSDKALRRNYSRIGNLSFAIFLLVQGKNDIHDGALTELEALFRTEAISEHILNDYVGDLKSGNAEGAFRGFVAAFSKALSSDEYDNDQIFDNLGSAPSVFDDDVLESLQLTINEASVCYKHELYLATVVLCGKIIETVIKNAYKGTFGNYPFVRDRNGNLTDREMGFGIIRKQLREQGVLLDDALEQQLELIYAHRSAAIHRNVRVPTKDTAEGIAILTRDVINIIYSHFK